MLSNYPEHKKYFSQPVASSSVFYLGKSKRKLETVSVDIHKEYVDNRDVVIKGNDYSIETNYIAFELSGAITYRDVVEGSQVIQCYSALINALIATFEIHCSDTGVHFYENDYDAGWNRRTIEEVFSYLLRDND